MASAEGLDALKRKAYARDATEADREALAAHFRAPERVEPDHAEDDEPEDGPVGDSPSADESAPTASARPSTWFRRNWAGLLTGTAVGVIIGIAGTALAVPPQSSLSVFLREPPLDQPDPPALLGSSETFEPSEVRLLAQVDDLEIWGTLGTMNVSQPGEPVDLTTSVCLVTRWSNGAGGASCGSVEDFSMAGIEMETGYDDIPPVTVRWGPTGGPTTSVLGTED